LLAYVPRLPSAEASHGFGLSNGSIRITPGTNRRLRVFAVTQIGASFVLLAGAGMLLTTLFALQRARTGFDTRNVLAVNVPIVSYARKPEEITGMYREAIRRIAALPGVDSVAVGTNVPWRDQGFFAKRMAKKIRGRNSGRCRQVSSHRSASQLSPAAISTKATAAGRRGSSSSARVSRSGCFPTRTRSTAA
jgi:hypothetical protein